MEKHKLMNDVMVNPGSVHLYLVRTWDLPIPTERDFKNQEGNIPYLKPSGILNVTKVWRNSIKEGTHLAIYRKLICGRGRRCYGIGRYEPKVNPLTEEVLEHIWRKVR